MASITAFCETMRRACEDWSLGYDQANRWDIRDGGECDCSSLVIWALRQAGFDTGSASYTGDMSDELTARGWKRLPYSMASVKAGDILLNDEHHVCAVISGSGANAVIAQASIDENGRATGGYAGDQSGRETNTRPVYTYWAGWDCILRYPGSDSGNSGSDEGSGSGTLDVDGYVGPKTIAEWQRQCGTTTDGTVSGQMADCAGWYPRMSAVTFEATGSELMRVVQERVGVPNPTGIISRGTICHLQGWLVLSGYDVGGDSAGMLEAGTAKALQRSLNDGRWADGTN